MFQTVWPILAIITGVLVLVDALLPVRLPIFRMLLAAVLLGMGITYLGGGKRPGANARRETSAFRSQYIDLARGEALPELVQVRGAFCATRVRLPVEYNITIRVSGAFCDETLPDAQNVLFGQAECHCGSQDPAAPKLDIEAACAFGSMRFFF